MIEVRLHDESPTTYPLCQRDAMRATGAAMRQTTRFVTDMTVPEMLEATGSPGGH